MLHLQTIVVDEEARRLVESAVDNLVSRGTKILVKIEHKYVLPAGSRSSKLSVNSRFTQNLGFS